MTVSAAARRSRTVMPQNTCLSTKDIPVAQRLIFPLDVPSNEEALKLVNILGDSVYFYKVGLELLMGGRWIDLVNALVAKDKAVMLDAKIFDVPETVRAAIKRAVEQHVKFITVHASDEALKAAVAERKNGVKILAVTVLTSVNTIDREEFGFEVPVEKLVLSRAKRALEIGCDGVISSGLEAPQLRKTLGDRFLIVTPGIRPVENKVVDDDQKRTTDVEEAFRNGADYIVIGRPIRQAVDPKRAAMNVQKRIAAVFSS